MTTLALTIYRGLTFGPLTIDVVDANGDPYTFPGGTWLAFAEYRANSSGAVLLDLSPTINAAASQITIEKTYAATGALSEGNGSWDLILQTPAGKRLGTFIGGTVAVKTSITQPV